MKKNKILTLATTAAVSLTMLLAPATTFAAGCWTEPSSPVTPKTTTQQAAGHRAAQTLVEIVGLNNRACQNMAGNADGQTDGATDQADPLDRTDVTALAAARDCKILGMFGSSLNSNPDPYYYNYFYNCAAKTKGKALSDNAIYCIQKSLSPNLADTVEYQNSGASASVLARPEILIGSGANKYNKDTYKEYIAALRGNGAYTDYNPVIFNYKYNTVYQEGESLQRLAKVMNNIEAGTQNGDIDTDKEVQRKSGESTKGNTGRYGNPMVAANDYQLYVKGLSAYVYKEVMAKYGKLKSCVVIDPLSQEKDENIGAGYFAAYDNTTPTGLAKYARGAECVENVTTNLATTQEGTEDSTVFQSKDGKTYKVTDKLVGQADVIILQGVQSNYGTMTKDAFITMMKNKGIDVSHKIIIDSNPQCVYGLTCNSSETALGYGYYMGYIYPDILDPVDAVAFFENRCMHITDESALQSLMNTMVADSVKHLKDSSTKLSSDWYDTIRSDIKEGIAYYNGLSDAEKQAFYFTNTGTKGTPDQVAFTDEGGIYTSYDEEHVNSILKSDESLHTVTVTLSKKEYTYNGKAKKPSVTVKQNGQELEKSQYSVSYKNNVQAGMASVTVKGKQGSGYTGSKTITFKIHKASQHIKTGKLSRTYKKSTLKKAKTFMLSAKAKGKVTYAKSSGSKKLKISKNGKVTVSKNLKKGTYTMKIKVKAAATKNYKKASITKSVKVKVN